MRIVDPTYGTPAEEDASAVVAADVPARSLCLFSNSKPGANELLHGVAERLEAEHGFAGIGFSSKPNAAAGAAPDVLDHLAAQYRMAVVAIGD